MWARRRFPGGKTTRPESAHTIGTTKMSWGALLEGIRAGVAELGACASSPALVAAAAAEIAAVLRSVEERLPSLEAALASRRAPLLLLRAAQHELTLAPGAGDADDALLADDELALSFHVDETQRPLAAPPAALGTRAGVEAWLMATEALSPPAAESFSRVVMVAAAVLHRQVERLREVDEFIQRHVHRRACEITAALEPLAAEGADWVDQLRPHVETTPPVPRYRVLQSAAPFGHAAPAVSAAVVSTAVPAAEEQKEDEEEEEEDEDEDEDEDDEDDEEGEQDDDEEEEEVEQQREEQEQEEAGEQQEQTVEVELLIRRLGEAMGTPPGAWRSDLGNQDPSAFTGTQWAQFMGSPTPRGERTIDDGDSDDDCSGPAAAATVVGTGATGEQWWTFEPTETARDVEPRCDEYREYLRAPPLVLGADSGIAEILRRVDALSMPLPVGDPLLWDTLEICLDLLHRGHIPDAESLRRHMDYGITGNLVLHATDQMMLDLAYSAEQARVIRHSLTNCARLSRLGPQDPNPEEGTYACAYCERVVETPMCCGARSVDMRRARVATLFRKQVVGGRYRLEEKIADRKYHTLWRALDLQYKRLFVVKQVRPSLDGKLPLLSLLKRFARAMRVSTVLKRQRTDYQEKVFTTCFNWEQDAATGAVYELSEFFPKSRSVYQALLEDGPMAELKMLPVINNVLACLARLDACGLVHTDLTPHKILIQRSGTVQLIGLGHMMAQGSRDDVRPDFSPESLAYAAPERVMGGAVLAPAMHQYSCGATLFHLAVGQPPYPGLGCASMPPGTQPWVGTECDASMRRAILDDPFPRHLLTCVSRGMGAVLERLLRREPGERYEHVADARVEVYAGTPLFVSVLAEKSLIVAPVPPPAPVPGDPVFVTTASHRRMKL